MAVLKINTGSAWHTVVDGTLKVQKGGVWISPSHLYGHNGTSWVDSGYRGFPSNPVNLAVNAWATHDAVSFKWGAGTGGASVSGYEVMVRNAAGTTATTGTLIATKTDTASPSVDFTEVVQNTQYNVYVRAKTAAGLYSGWVGPLQIKMGKDAFTTYANVTKTRSWSKVAQDVIGYRDMPVGPVVPTSVKVTAIRYQITNSGWTSALSPWNNREIRHWGNGAQGTQFSWLSQTVDTTYNVTDYTSNGGTQGMVCLGIGWSSTAAGEYVATGDITVSGIETYVESVGTTTPAVANGYW